MSQTSEHIPPTSPAPHASRSPVLREGPAWPRLIALLVVVGALVVLATASGSFAAVAFILALIASVTIHEA
ncbi:MAG: hypothetical protein M3144_08465, partial [Actinomycetota bacterium]|nr:hypothetical protein [Actinomycetota bacterium]